MAQKPSKSKADRTTKGQPPKTPERVNTAIPRPSALTIGDALEYRVARLQIFSGYFVRRGCPIYTIAALDRATDLDVLSFKHVEMFRREMTIAECKSGSSAPLDRIFWLTGVRNYTSATQAILVRPGTKWNIKDFAKECGVQIVDLSRITEMESSLKIPGDYWPGISDREFFKENLESWNKALASESRYWELYHTLTSEIRFDDVFVAVNYLLSQMRQLTRHWPDYPREVYFRFLLTESISQLSVFLARIAERVFDLNSDDRRNFIRKGLTYGNLEPQYAERIMNSAYNITKQAVQLYTRRMIDIDKSLFTMPAPPSVDQVVRIVDELLASYPLSLTFPQICDLVTFEAFVKRSEWRSSVRRIFPLSDLAIRVEAVRKYLGTLVEMGACPGYLLDCLGTAQRPEKEEGRQAAGRADEQNTGQVLSASRLETAPSERTPSPASEMNGDAESPKQANLDLSADDRSEKG